MTELTVLIILFIAVAFFIAATYNWFKTQRACKKWHVGIVLHDKLDLLMNHALAHEWSLASTILTKLFNSPYTNDLPSHMDFVQELNRYDRPGLLETYGLFDAEHRTGGKAYTLFARYAIDSESLSDENKRNILLAYIASKNTHVQEPSK